MINIGQLPPSGGIVLQSNITDWEYLSWRKSVNPKPTEIDLKAKASFAGIEEEVDILIDTIFPPNSKTLEILFNCDGFEDCFNLLKNLLFSGKNMWVLRGYLLNDVKRTPMFIIDFPDDEETFYAFSKTEGKKYFSDNYELN